MRVAPLLFGSLQAAECPEYCNSCTETAVDCSNAGLTELTGEDFTAFESVDLSGNNFQTVPRQLRKLENLKNLNLSNNPIRSVNAFEFTNEFFSTLESVQFDECDELDYVAETAFFSLDSLNTVSFKNSALFFVSGQAFYECQQLKTIDFSGTDLKSIDSSLDIYLGIYSVEEVILENSSIQCDCINDWMQEADYIKGFLVGCPRVDSENCGPKVIRSNYDFNFSRGTTAKAMCFIGGAETLAAGSKRGRHSITYHSVDETDEGEYECTGTALDGSSVTVEYTITTHENNENDVIRDNDDDELDSERDYISDDSDDSSESDDSEESESSDDPEESEESEESEDSEDFENLSEGEEEDAEDANEDESDSNVDSDSESDSNNESSNTDLDSIAAEDGSAEFYLESSTDGSGEETDDINIGGFDFGAAQGQFVSIAGLMVCYLLL